MIFKRIFLITALLISGMISGQSFAQDAMEDEADVTVKPIQSQKERFISLFIGIDSQEQLSTLPDDASFRGDFRKVTKVSLARDTKTLLFTPLKEGLGTLQIVDSKGNLVHEFRVDVKKSNLTKVAREVKALLSDIEGIEIKIINNRVVVDGLIWLPRDKNRIYSVVRQYDGIASDLTRMNPGAQRKIAQLIEKDIGNPEITVRAVNEKFLLEGVASDEAEKQKSEIIAKTYVPDVVMQAAVKDGEIKERKVDTVINLITVKPSAPKEPGKIIQIVIHYVELNKDYQKGFSFSWTPSLSDNTNVTFSNDSQRGAAGIVSSITGVVSNLLPKLNWMKSHGHARVLESTTLIVQDGQKGEIKSVTSVPFTKSNVNGSTTEFQDAGIITSVTPGILSSRSDSVRMQLDFSISNLLQITANGPLISKNNLTTMITVRSGQSAAVGGLISNKTSTDYNKLPASAANPIFSLHASKNFQRNQSQFVVFVTPIIKSSASAGSEKIKQKFRLRD